MNIDQLPIWADCPFRDKVPNEYMIRRGNGEIVLHFVNGESELHVAFKESAFEEDQTNALRSMIGLIGNARFEKEHPDEALKLPRRMAEAIRDHGAPSAADIALWNRLKVLTGLAAA